VPISAHAGISIVDTVDACIVELPRGVAVVDAIVGEVNGIGVHDVGEAR
jgi:hypothetical protein